ncbi:hypothetical protein T10_390 [Trichinella papuae]|uniref:Uncharacterized protein n=1 Tax=Trichinella papuae TaxID=268474 RepID=A0A0V1MUL4_9BILA|nr:hypothetical protein T10_390 [Trichinella papuae]
MIEYICRVKFLQQLVKAVGRSVGRSVSFKEHQMLAALKLFVFGQACKVTIESAVAQTVGSSLAFRSLQDRTEEQSRQPRQQN